ncbi:GNAT family N-acetyltransferase [Bacillus sp. FJAT-27245]|uniref:GNAT family N-acetyltransferase n=1 Tax=Bacillus sp. FJAT-27245 TaxID=1684144 RepID=UPI0006A7C62B|nr:GNAT family N-acetyltransferase [Bacillus sp. FJAT-27245]
MEYSIIEDFDFHRLVEVHELFQNEWWTRNRSFEDVKELISQSGVAVGLVCSQSSKLVGFARAMTDTLYRAFIFDVIVAEDVRGKGAGSILMNAILSHPKIKDVERVELYCPERLLPYYKRFGFSTEVNGSTLMRLNR